MELLQVDLSVALLYQVLRPVLLGVLWVLHQEVLLGVRQSVVQILVALSVDLSGVDPLHHRVRAVPLLVVGL